MKQVSQHDANQSQQPDTATSAEQALSALMDGELGEFELRRLLAIIQARPDLLATWERYNLVRAAFQPEPLTFKSLASRDDMLLPDALSSRIMVAIAEEPVPASAQTESGTDASQAARWKGTVARLAVAASVAVAVFAGMQTLLDQPSSPMLADVQGTPSVNPQHDAAVQIAVDSEAQQRLNDYIRSVSIPGRLEPVSESYNILLESPMLRPVSDRELVEEVQRTSP